MIAALVAMHEGLERLGPGDEAFNLRILSRLPVLPNPPRIADLGCGTGAGALFLAAHFKAPVSAVDLSAAFLEYMKRRARERKLAHLIRPVVADMGNLGWPEASIDLLWSEGAAYNLTFAGALAAWRPLVAPGGVAVISELSWWESNPPAPARAFWETAYPAMGSEAANVGRAEAAGFKVLGVHRLPSAAWWDNYYGPLLQRIAAIRPSAGPVMQAVISETETEIELFRQYSGSYGYSFYLLQR
jgi:SAM-dependent methyltransferase